MPWFDIIVIGILLVSAVVGFVRGAAREMLTVISFLLAALAAVYGLKFTGPIGREAIDPDWAGTVAAGVVSFILVYIALRLAGAGLAKAIHATPVVGLLDRSIGVGFGLIRALAVLGAFSLVIPPDRAPPWLRGAATYPLTQAAGSVLKAVAPKGLDMAGRLRPALGAAVRDGSANGARDSGRDGGYEARDRGGIDDLVEKSR